MEIDGLNKLLLERTIAPDEFLAELWKLSTGHTRKGHVLAAGKLETFRTRTFKEKPTPQNISDLSYPPVDKSKLNRANEAGEQVFYSSAGLPTTLRESRVQEGEFIVVSKWKNTDDIILQSVGLSENPTGLEKLYHDIFTDPDESIYPYSSQVAKHLMKGVPPLGLLYPSIINSNKSHNIVLHKEQVDNKLEFINAALYRVDKIVDDSSFNVIELDFATKLEGDLLDWKGRKKQWTAPAGSTLTATSIGWDWDIRLEDGTIVEPH